MFIAKTVAGKFISTLNYSKHQLELLKDKETFLCPSCQDEVYLKVGMKKTPHFAHKHVCHAVTEGETEEHLKGKKILFSWLYSQLRQVEMEKYIPEISARPDVFAVWKNKKIAIEFQCSIIPSNDINRRTDNYQRIGIETVWIVHQKHLRTLKNNTIKMNEFLQSFIQLKNKNLYLFSLNPSFNEFSIHTHILPISKKLSLFASYHQPLLNKCFFHTLFRKKPFPTQLFDQWVQLTQSWLFRLPLQPFARKIPLLNILYHQFLHPLQLPPIVGLPLPLMYLIENPPLDWQARIWLSLLKSKGVGDSIEKSLIRKWFYQQIYDQSIKQRDIRNITMENVYERIREYFELLVELGYLVENKEYYIVNKPLNHLKTNVEMNIKHREHFFKTMKGKIITYYMKKY